MRSVSSATQAPFEADSMYQVEFTLRMTKSYLGEQLKSLRL